MAWSTREIAELTGTSLRAVRHYHEVGLLAQPERRPNGYKLYGVEHVVRLLRIRRLTDLGFSLQQIAEHGDDEHPEEALRTLDAELGATIERLQRIRVELGMILRRAAPTDLPTELAPVARVGLSPADRSFMAVLTRVLSPARLATYTEMLRDNPQDAADAEFEALPADADETTRQALAEGMAPRVQAMVDRYPALRSEDTDAPRGVAFAQETAGRAMRELYNRAQLDVLRRTSLLLAEQAPPAGAPRTPAS